MKKEEIIAKYGKEEYEKRLNYGREFRKRNPDYYKKYYEDNKEKLDAYSKKYYENNNDYHKNFYLEHKEQYQSNHESYYSTQKGRAQMLLSTYNKNDRDKNRGEGDLTKYWIIENIFNVGVCHYCGKKFDWTELGCDRKDSSLPHTKENCVPCCKDCNNRKRTKSYEEFKRTIEMEKN